MINSQFASRMGNRFAAFPTTPPTHSQSPGKNPFRFWAIYGGFFCLLLLSGCGSIVSVNQSSSTATIKVASLSGEEGAPTTLWYRAGEIGLEPGKTGADTFTLLPYSVLRPGNQYTLLRLEAGNGRVERAFVPYESICTVTIAPDSSLDLNIAPVPDDRQLREELTARVPGLQQALFLNDTRTVANLLLHWIANNVDDALVQQDSNHTLPIIVKSDVSFAYHEFFRRDRGGVVCGGFAVMLQKLLLSFDIDALIIDFGDPASGLTHMSVVIPEQAVDGTWDFYIHDPKLNFRCADATTGQPIGLFEIMDRELTNRFSTVNILQASNADRDFVGTAGQKNDARYIFNRVKGTRYFYRRPGYTLQDHMKDYNTQFVNAGFTSGNAGFFELMQKQFYTVRQGNNPVSRQAFVQELAKRKIPLVYPSYKWPQ